MSKAPVVCMVGMIVGFGTAQLFVTQLHMPIIGWFIGGTVMALAANYTFPPAKPRSHPMAIGLSLVLGVVVSAVMNLLPRL